MNSESVVEKVRRLIDGYATCPRIEHGGDKAYYTPINDTIRVPSPAMFDVAEEYACTLAHELIHSTGHFSRLNRLSDKQVRFGSEAYSKAELIAEIGGSFLCSEMQIDVDKIFDNSVAYINSWRNALNQNQTLIISASSAAERAVNFVLGKRDGAETATSQQELTQCA